MNCVYQTDSTLIQVHITWELITVTPLGLYKTHNLELEVLTQLIFPFFFSKIPFVHMWSIVLL